MKDQEEQYQEFTRLYCRYEHQIRAFLRSLLPAWQDVDEVISDVVLVLWKKFDQFDTNTEFMRWACVVARYEVLRYRRNKARNKVVFSDEALDLVIDEGLEELDLRTNEFNALRTCMEKLKDKQKNLINVAYEPDTKIKDVATSLGLNPHALYMKLNRIRQQLSKCVRFRLQELEA